MKDRTFFKSAAVISLGGLFAKGIGAIYRIPLTSYLGSYGMGLYQMAYPLFLVLLTFSSAGIPSAFSRIIARETALGRENGSTAKTALKLFALLGLCGTALMCLFAPYMSGLQGEERLLPCYFALSPSVFFVSLIAVLRGYFQGKSNMFPTAASEAVEQVVKSVLGLFFAHRFAAEPAQAVAFTLLAVSLSELAAFLYLIARYRREPKTKCMRVLRASGYDLLSAALPVMASSALLPLSQTLDSIIVVRLLGAYSERAVALYGLFAGGAVSLVSLPASLSYGLAAASVPAVSSAFACGREGEGRRRALFALLLTLALSLPLSAALFFFARPVAGALYPSLSAGDGELLIRLVRLSAGSAAALASVDTLAACLAGMGRAKYAAGGMLLAVCVKFILQFALVSQPALSVSGAAIAQNICYPVAFFFDLFYTVKKTVGREKRDNDRKFGHGERRTDGARAREAEKRGQGACAKRRSPFGGKFKGREYPL